MPCDSRLPALNARQVISILKRYDFEIDRQSGSHAVLIHPDGRRTTVPVHGKRDLGKGILHQIVKDAGLSIEDLMKQ